MVNNDFKITEVSNGNELAFHPLDDWEIKYCCCCCRD